MSTYEYTRRVGAVDGDRSDDELTKLQRQLTEHRRTLVMLLYHTHTAQQRHLANDDKAWSRSLHPLIDPLIRQLALKPTQHLLNHSHWLSHAPPPCSPACQHDMPQNTDGMNQEASDELSLRQQTCDVALYDRHAVGRQRAGLVRADRRRVAHRLTRVQVTHQVVVLHHFLHQSQAPASHLTQQ